MDPQSNYASHFSSNPSDLGNGQLPSSFPPPPQPPPLDPLTDTTDLSHLVRVFAQYQSTTYYQGLIRRSVRQNPDGTTPVTAKWDLCYVELVGSHMHMYPASAIPTTAHWHAHAPQYIASITSASKPSRIHLADTHVIPKLDTFTKSSISHANKDNIMQLNTLNCNLLWFELASPQAIVAFVEVFNVIAFEYSKLNEAFTHYLLNHSDPLKSLTVPQSPSFENWVRIKFPGSVVDWVKVWCVVQGHSLHNSSLSSLFRRSKHMGGMPTSNSSSSLSSVAAGEPTLHFYKNKMFSHALKKQPIVSVSNVFQSFAIYPERPHLIDLSTLCKIQGSVHVQSPHITALTNKPNHVLVLTESTSDLGMLLISIMTHFNLYGLPPVSDRCAGAWIDSASKIKVTHSVSGLFLDPHQRLDLDPELPPWDVYRILESAAARQLLGPPAVAQPKQVGHDAHSASIGSSRSSSASSRSSSASDSDSDNDGEKPARSSKASSVSQPSAINQSPSLALKPSMTPTTSPLRSLDSVRKSTPTQSQDQVENISHKISTLSLADSSGSLNQETPRQHLSPPLLDQLPVPITPSSPSGHPGQGPTLPPNQHMSPPMLEGLPIPNQIPPPLPQPVLPASVYSPLLPLPKPIASPLHSPPLPQAILPVSPAPLPKPIEPHSQSRSPPRPDLPFTHPPASPVSPMGMSLFGTESQKSRSSASESSSSGTSSSESSYASPLSHVSPENPTSIDHSGSPDTKSRSPNIRTGTPKIKSPDAKPSSPNIRQSTPKIKPSTPDLKPSSPKIKSSTPDLKSSSPKIESNSSIKSPEIEPSQSPDKSDKDESLIESGSSDGSSSGSRNSDGSSTTSSSSSGGSSESDTSSGSYSTSSGSLSNSDNELAITAGQSRHSMMPAQPFDPNSVDFMAGLPQPLPSSGSHSSISEIPANAPASYGPPSLLSNPYATPTNKPDTGVSLVPQFVQFGGLLSKPKPSLLAQHQEVQKRQQFYAQLQSHQQQQQLQNQVRQQEQYAVSSRPRGPLLSGVNSPSVRESSSSGLLSVVSAREQVRVQQKNRFSVMAQNHSSGVAELVERGAGTGKPLAMDFERDRDRLKALEQRQLVKEMAEERQRIEEVRQVQMEHQRFQLQQQQEVMRRQQEQQEIMRRRELQQQQQIQQQQANMYARSSMFGSPVGLPGPYVQPPPPSVRQIDLDSESDESDSYESSSDSQSSAYSVSGSSYSDEEGYSEGSSQSNKSQHQASVARGKSNKVRTASPLNDASRLKSKESDRVQEAGKKKKSSKSRESVVQQQQMPGYYGAMPPGQGMYGMMPPPGVHPAQAQAVAYAMQMQQMQQMYGMMPGPWNMMNAPSSPGNMQQFQPQQSSPQKARGAKKNKNNKSSKASESTSNDARSSGDGGKRKKKRSSAKT